uniref:hypothetical protein n=1 Tax=Cysteiniphilum halobium TaxID=2219059 RepID=UPI001AAC81FD
SGKVVKVLDFGEFINILPCKDGLLSYVDIENVDVNPHTMAEGKGINDMVQNIDRMGKINIRPVQ